MAACMPGQDMTKKQNHGIMEYMSDPLYAIDKGFNKGGWL